MSALRAPVTCAALCMLAGFAAQAADGDASQGAPRDSLLVLVQADALVASKPDPAADPQDPAAGAALRLRRLRAGEDLALGDFRLRVLFEAAADTAAGAPFPPLAGGRLPFGGPVRTTETYVSWAPARAFHVDAGSLRVAFSLARQIDEGDLRLPERAAFADAFLPDFRLGAAIGGDLGELAYSAAVMSADPVLDAGLFDRGVLVAGRLVAEPLGPVGLTPWRRAPSDPWYGWFRFAGGLSVLYGTVAAPDTLAVDPDFTAQWRSLVVTAEYLYAARFRGTAVVPGSAEQGAAVEPGVTLFARRLDLVARGDWSRANAADVWGAGAGLTAYAPDPRLRLHAGLERRWGTGAPAAGGDSSYWAIVRLAVVAN